VPYSISALYWGVVLKSIYKCRVCGRFVEEPFHCGRPAVLVLDGVRRLRLSKLVSGLLRHFPWEACLELDEGGWVDVDVLVKGIRECWRNRELYRWVTREHVVALALLDPKGRFELSRDGRRIRATYGHSVRVRVDHRPLSLEELPEKLYHGTVKRVLGGILREGIKPMKRLMVHLTNRFEDAVETGRRHGPDVVVLVVDPHCLVEKGYKVYRAGRNVYLVSWVPPECIVERVFVG